VRLRASSCVLVRLRASSCVFVRLGASGCVWVRLSAAGRALVGVDRFGLDIVSSSCWMLLFVATSTMSNEDFLSSPLSKNPLTVTTQKTLADLLESNGGLKSFQGKHNCKLSKVLDQVVAADDNKAIIFGRPGEQPIRLARRKNILPIRNFVCVGTSPRSTGLH
jgi:hypothetical protein